MLEVVLHHLLVLEDQAGQKRQVRNIAIGT